MKVKGVIDSMNLSSEHLEDYFNNDDYIIETVKSIGTFNPERWQQAFNASITRNIIEAKILHTSQGLELPIKRHNRSKKRQTLEFAGLHGYNDKSELLSELLAELMEQVGDEIIVRLDVAIDFQGKIPNKVIKHLCKDRKPSRYWNTTYYKSTSEKKSNNRLNIKTYCKSKKKNNLEDEVTRLEFCFLSPYLGKLQVKDIQKSFKKMEKTIKRFSGVEAKILSL